jgi:molybdopterin-guanine dinucleotide biosynthesis protein A
MLFVERHRYSLAEFAFETTDPFFNVNTPQDLHRAETILESA